MPETTRDRCITPSFSPSTYHRGKLMDGKSVQRGDVRRFDEILAADFLCSNPDGTLIDRAQFLAQTARSVTITGLVAEDVQIRLFGDLALIHARTRYRTADGEERQGRYTDAWARRDGKWLAIAAHVTR
jgi:ketosteroid isomerase-like protein